CPPPPGRGLLAETGSAARRFLPPLPEPTRISSREKPGPCPPRLTCSIGSAAILCPLARSIVETSGPRLTTTLFWTEKLFTTRVLLMITFVLEYGTTRVRMLGARKSPQETNVKLAGAGAPKPTETPTENPGVTGAQPT